jgi:predicted ATP-grasp superfamily ATP-dependent carboligase
MKKTVDETANKDVLLSRDGIMQGRESVENRTPQKVAYDALILDAQLRQSLVTMRSLGRRGLCVAALEVANLLKPSPHVPTFASRWCQGTYIAPSYERGTEVFLDYLLRFLDNTGARVLIPSADGTVALLRKHRQEVEKRTRVALAADEALDKALNKTVTLEIAQRLGIAIPRGVTVSSVSEVDEAIRTVGLPAVIKPVESWLWGWDGENGIQGERYICALVTTSVEARRSVEELTHSGGKTLFQQFLPGRREAVSLLYAHGKMYARFAQWAKRTQPPLGGTSVYRQSIALPPDISRAAECLVREIGLEGYSEVEFRRDSRGKPYLMEINPRLSASVEVAVRAGVDFPSLLYQWANGDRIDLVAGYREGRWMRYLEGDALALMQTIEQWGRPGVVHPARAMVEFMGAFFIPASYDYVDWKDARPLWTAILDFFSRTRARLKK